MKHLVTLFIILFTPLCFAQNTGMIVGKILDKEFSENPLVLANVSVKGTSISANTDLTGLFVIENLEDGIYTLVCSFTGYETKELKVEVSSDNATKVKLALGASSISLADLASLGNTAEKEDQKETTELK